MAFEVPRRRFQTILESALPVKKLAEGAPQIMDTLPRHLAPFHADNIETREIGAVSHNRSVGDQISLKARHAHNERVPPNACELMNGAQPAEKNAVADRHMPA